MVSTTARSALSPESWSALFDFLDPSRLESTAADRDAPAEAKCLEIRRKLETFFSARGCSEPEDLAMDTLLRVAARCRDLDGVGPADRTKYFYGVARNVLHEWHRQGSAEAAHRESIRMEFLRRSSPGIRSWAHKEAVHRHLAVCLSTLTERARTLILSYYAEDRRAKIEHHRAMADEIGQSVNSLRIEIHRIRRTLRECLTRRLAEPAPVRDCPPGGAS